MVKPEPTELPAPPDGTKRWPVSAFAAVVFVAALFIISQLVAAVVIGVAASLLHGGTGQGGSAVVTQFLFVLLAEGLVLAGLAWLLKRVGISFRDLGLVRPQPLDAGRAVVGYVVYFAAYIALVAVTKGLISGLDITQKQDVGFSEATGVPMLLLTAIALIVLAPLAEEVLMRGFLFTTLRKRGVRVVVAMVVTSVVFAAGHLFGGEQGSSLLWIAAIDTFALSLVLCYLRETTGRLWAGIGVHAIKNAVAFTALFILHSS